MDEEIVKPQDNLYTIAWEADFDHELFERGSDSWQDTATRLPNDDASSVVDLYVTGDNERSSVHDNQRSSVYENERSSDERNESSSRENEKMPTLASIREVTSSPDEPLNSAETENVVEKELNDADNAPKRVHMLLCWNIGK